jgi:PAS domain S-box-containing protein
VSAGGGGAEIMNPIQSLKILLVEANESDAQSLQECIRQGGFKDLSVDVVQSVGQAVRYLESNHPDVTLLDLAPPDKNGLEAAQDLLRLYPSVPIIAVAGVENEATAAEAIRFGIQDYIIKGRTDRRSIVRSIAYAVERKRSEMEFRRTREYLENLFNYANAPIIVWDTHLHITRFNRAFEKLTGRTAEEVLGKHLDILFPEETKSESLSKIMRTLTEKWEVVEIPILHKDGSVRIALWNSANVYAPDGKTVEVTIAQGQEITKRKAMENALRESEEKFRLIATNTPDHILVQDAELRYVFVLNPQLGLSEKEMIGKTDYEILSKEDADSITNLKKNVLATGIPKYVNIPIVAKDGSTEYFEGSYLPRRDSQGGVNGILGYFRNVTTRIRIENALKESEERYRSLVESSPDGVIMHRGGKFIYANSVALQLYDADSLAQLQTKAVLDLIHPDDRAAIKNRMERGIGGQRVALRETRIVSFKGLVKYVETVGSKVDLLDGPAMQIIIRDITERKLAEKQIEHLASLPQWNPNPIIETDLQATIIYVNDATLKCLKEIGLKEDVRVFLPKDIDEIITASDHSKEAEIFTRELPIQDRIFIETILVLRKLNFVRYYATDITEIKKKESELQRLNRTLRALSNSNQAMMHARNEIDFMNAVCRIVVEDCGHKMVWIGLAQDDEIKSVRPVASAGFEEGYLEILNITWADTERGRGPTGTAIRTGKPSLCKNMLADPRFEPWREEALKRGYASSVVLPLKYQNRTFGAINIYSKDPDSFSESEVRLLTELADDLAYGITAIRLQTAHAKAEEALRISEVRYRSLFNGMTEGFALHEIICDEKGSPCDYRFLDVNPAFERITGLKREDIMNKTRSEVPQLRGDDPEWVSIYGKVALTGEPIEFENYSPALKSHYDVFSYRPAPSQFAVIIVDITERKRMENEIRESRDELEKRVRERTKELMAEMAERKKAEQAVDSERRRFNEVLELLPVYVVLLTPDYHVTFANRFFRERFGESHGRRCFEYLFGRSEPCEICETYRVLEDGKSHRWEWTGPDGRNYDIFDFPFTDADGSPLIMEMGIDITERKRAEEEARSLAKRIVEVQEEERQRIARELHDDICQRLTATKLHVDAMEGQVPKSGKPLLKKLRLVRKQLGNSVREVRRISANLRPSALDDLGPVAALQLLCREFEEEHDIKVRFVSRHVEEALIDKNVEITIYRVAQEALSNILKHASANEALVTLTFQEGKLTLLIKDDGKGFNAAKEMNRKGRRGFGLVDIKERVELIGGSVSIVSAPRKGTALRIDISQKARKNNEKDKNSPRRRS